MTAVFIIAFLGTLLVGVGVLFALAAVERRRFDAEFFDSPADPQPARIRPSLTPTYAALVAENPEVARVLREAHVARARSSVLRTNAAFRGFREAMQKFGEAVNR